MIRSPLTVVTIAASVGVVLALLLRPGVLTSTGEAEAMPVNSAIISCRNTPEVPNVAVTVSALDDEFCAQPRATVLPTPEPKNVLTVFQPLVPSPKLMVVLTPTDANATRNDSGVSVLV